MRVEEIRRLIKLVEESQINELEVRRLWTRVRIQKRPGNHSENGSSTAQATPLAAAHAQAGAIPREGSGAPAGPASSVPSAEGGEDTGLVPVRSPMVGTFYRAPSPQSPPYVDLNQRVEAGQVVCIVEAMKLMNEIESEVAGVIVKVLVQNGQPVEFSQPLFLVRPD
jgi:acetyl-CoA carboxylase biotin carboxyl carrier protein